MHLTCANRRLSVLLAACSGLLVTLLLTQATAQELKTDNLTANHILDRMAKAYANCERYRDSGVVKTVIIQTDHTRIVEKPFTTAFVRPDRFRFEYRKKEGYFPEQRYIVWRQGKEVQTWWNIQPEIGKPDSLDLALAGATGVSGGSAHTVPALLLPDEVSGRRLTDMTELERVQDVAHGTVDCFRIRGRYANIPRTIWIDKVTFLVRRIEGEHRFDGFRTETTTTYDPVIDSEIPDDDLDFNPPRQE